MAYEHNYKFWLATKKDLEDGILKQQVFAKLMSIEEREIAHDIFAELYATYVDLVNKLGYIYSRTFQVQKRTLVKKLLEAASNRLIELRTELKNIEVSEFTYLDQKLIQKKLVPDDVRLLRPPYFPYWRPLDIQQLIDTGTMEDTNAEDEAQNKKGPKRPKKAVIPLWQQELTKAITIIQSHQRAHVCRKLLTNIHYDPWKYKPRPPDFSSKSLYNFTHKPDQDLLFLMKKTEFNVNYNKIQKNVGDFEFYRKPITGDEFEKTVASNQTIVAEDDEPWASLEGEYTIDSSIENLESVDSKFFVREVAKELPEDKQVRSVKIIQRAWKRYKLHKAECEKNLKYKILIGMANERKIRQNLLADAQKLNDYQRQHVEKFEAEFIKAVEDEKVRIVRVKGPWIMEDISDDIRNWFKEFYDATGSFHIYPDEFQGGTILVLRGETMTVEEFNELKRRPKKPEDLKKEADAKKKEIAAIKKQKATEMRYEKKYKDAAAKKGEIYFNLAKELENKNIVQIQETLKEYDIDWRAVDEEHNYSEAPFMQWITEDKFAEIHQELRITVDELMRVEYELLKKALCTDNKTSYKKPKPAPIPKGKKRDKKKIKDLTGSRSIESLYNEMVNAGIIIKYPKRSFEDIIGDYNYCAYDMRNYFLLDTTPSCGEVRDIFREWILGMGPLNLKKPRSIGIIGPYHSGKHQLCDVLASEINAVMFNLSPEVVVKYAADMPYLIHLINKMSRILQPTVLLIHDIHRIFAKTVPPEWEQFKPTLMSKYLQKKIIKEITEEDKVIFLATTDEPWAAKATIKKVFDKILLLPKTDYATAFMLYRTLSLEQLGVPRDFEQFSSVAMIARNYNTGDIYRNIIKTLKVERRVKFSRKPLKANDFLETFLEDNLFPPEETDQYAKWYDKTNKLQKERQKHLQFMDKARKEMLQNKKK